MDKWVNPLPQTEHRWQLQRPCGAVFAYQREEYKEALNYFLALSFTGANQWTVGNVLYWMADCYRQRKEYNSALIMLDKILVMENPKIATDALIQKGLIYRTLGREELAMIVFRDLLDDYPESDYARLLSCYNLLKHSNESL